MTTQASAVYENSVFQVISEVNGMKRRASGFLISEDYALTAAHAIFEADSTALQIEAWFPLESGPLEAQLVAYSESADVALLKVSAGDFERRPMPLMTVDNYDTSDLQLLGYSGYRMDEFGPQPAIPTTGSLTVNTTGFRMGFESPTRGDSGGAILHLASDLVIGMHLGTESRRSRGTKHVMLHEIFDWVSDQIIEKQPNEVDELLQQLSSGTDKDFLPEACRHPDCWDTIEFLIISRVLSDKRLKSDSDFEVPDLAQCALRAARSRYILNAATRLNYVVNGVRFAATGIPKDTSVADASQDFGTEQQQALRQDWAAWVAQNPNASATAFLSSAASLGTLEYLEAEALWADAGVARIATAWERAAPHFCSNNAQRDDTGTALQALSEASGAIARMPNLFTSETFEFSPEVCETTYFDNLAAQRLVEAGNAIQFRVNNGIAVAPFDSRRAATYFAAAAAVTNNQALRLNALEGYTALLAADDGRLAASALSLQVEAGRVEAAVRSDYGFVRAIESDAETRALLTPSFQDFQSSTADFGYGDLVIETQPSWGAAFE